MSNEAKGPYTVQTYDDGFIVVSPAGKVVYSNHYKGDCDRQCHNFNEAVSSALTSQAARVRELERLVLEAIDAEPELPGPMPDDMWNIINGNRTACTHAFVVCVQETKAGIRERVLKALTPKEPQ